MLLDADGKTFFGKEEELSGGKNTYWKLDVDANTSAILLADSPVGTGRRFVKTGDYLWAGNPLTMASGSTNDGPDELYRIPIAGGAANPWRSKVVSTPTRRSGRHHLFCRASIPFEQRQIGGTTTDSRWRRSTPTDHPGVLPRFEPSVAFVNLPDTYIANITSGEVYRVPHMVKAQALFRGLRSRRVHRDRHGALPRDL